MKKDKEAKIVAKAKRLLPYGYTPRGAVTACLYYYRQTAREDVMTALVKAVQS